MIFYVHFFVIFFLKKIRPETDHMSFPIFLCAKFDDPMNVGVEGEW